MRYTMELLKRHLIGIWPETVVKKGAPASEPIELFPLELYDQASDIPCQPGHVYLCDSKSYPAKRQISANCMLLCLGTPAFVADLPPGATSLFSPEHVSAREVFRECRTCDEKYRQWGALLTNRAVHSADQNYIQFLLDESYPIIGNSLTLVDPNLQLIAYAGSSDAEKKLGLDKKQILDGQETYFTSFQRLLLTGEEQPLALTYTINHQGIESIVSHLVTDRTFIGTLVTHATEQALSLSDLKLVEFLRLNLLQVVQEYNNHRTQYVDLTRNVLKNMIDGTPDIEQRMRTRLRRYGIWSGGVRTDSYMFFVLSRLQKNTAVPMSYICYQLESLAPSSLSFELDSSYYFLLNFTHYEGENDDLLDEVSAICEKNGLCAGASNEFADIFALRMAFVQAARAIMTGLQRPNPESIIYHFSEHALPFIWESITSELSLEYICAPGVLRLAEHDRRYSRVNYCYTLQVYLESQMNISRAAKSLHLARNTFLERIARVLRILAMDIENPDTRLYVEISLRLLANTRKE